MWTLFALYMFQISGERLDTLVAALDGAVGGVAVDKTGFIYVADFRNKVWRITPEGEVEVFADYLYGASGNHIDAQGRLLQSNFFGNTLTRINRDGSHETLTTELNGPVGVTELDDSDIAICNCSGNEVVRLDKQRKLEVIADGGHLLYKVNGVVVNEAFEAKPNFGRILLQTEQAEMFVRRFELWPLNKPPAD